MPRIINDINDKEKIVKHKNCGILIGYFDSELTSVSHDFFSIICPKCGETFLIKKILYNKKNSQYLNITQKDKLK